jgi:hypothetical protein
VNAARNLKRLATDIALPVASRSAMNDTELDGLLLSQAGK